jgi:hypothetical protein
MTYHRDDYRIVEHVATDKYSQTFPPRVFEGSLYMDYKGKKIKIFEGPKATEINLVKSVVTIVAIDGKEYLQVDLRADLQTRIPMEDVNG